MAYDWCLVKIVNFAKNTPFLTITSEQWEKLWDVHWEQFFKDLIDHVMRETDSDVNM